MGLHCFASCPLVALSDEPPPVAARTNDSSAVGENALQYKFATPSMARPTQAEPKPGQAWPGKVRPAHTRPGPSQARPCWARQGQTSPSQA